MGGKGGRVDGAAEEEMRMRTSGWWKERSHTSAVDGEGMSKKPRSGFWSGFWKPGERVDERVFLFFYVDFLFHRFGPQPVAAATYCSLPVLRPYSDHLFWEKF